MTIDRWRIPKGSGTHVLMNGGILLVPDEEIQEFHRVYLETINSGTKLYVVEQKTERFNFFVDLDYKAKEKLSDGDLYQFCDIIHSAIGVDRKFYVARAQPRPLKDGLIKSGVHIHWPGLVVTKTRALQLRTKIIEELGEGPWEQIIDASVYGGSGLRMLWSHKKPSGDPYIPRDLPKTVETLNLMSIRVTGEDAQASKDLIEVDGLSEFIRRSIKGQDHIRSVKVRRHEHDGWFLQTDSTYCENIGRPHKSNHIWFNIRAGRISQRCFDEECKEFKGAEHILPPSIVDKLTDVAIVGSHSTSVFKEFFSGPPPSARPTFGAGPAAFRTVGF
jgi:hypothetical protein